MFQSSDYSKIAEILENEIDWLSKIIQRRFDLYYQRTYTPITIDKNGKKVYDYSSALKFEGIETILPDKLPNQFSYCEFIHEFNLSFEERLLLVLSLVPQLNPDFILKKFKNELNHPQIGLVKGQNFQGFLPSGLTFMFLFCGDNLEKRFRAQSLLSSGVLVKEKVIHLESALSGDPFYNGRLILSRAYFDDFTTNSDKSFLKQIL